MPMNYFPHVRFVELTKRQKNFLIGLNRRWGDDSKKKNLQGAAARFSGVSARDFLSLGVKKDGNIFYLRDFGAPALARKKIQDSANSGLNLVRFGISVRVLLPQGEVVRADERYQHLKPLVAGMLHQGESFSERAQVELLEEAYLSRRILTDSKYQTWRLLPKGWVEPLIFGDAPFGVPYKGISFEGDFSKKGFCEIPEEAAVDAVFLWDLRKIKGENSLIVGYDEGEWFAGGKSMITPVIIDNKKNVVGVCSGQQGVILFKELSLHPGLKD